MDSVTLKTTCLLHLVSDQFLHARVVGEPASQEPAALVKPIIMH